MIGFEELHMTLDQLDMSCIYIGLKVRSSHTGNSGTVTKIQYGSSFRCLTHEDYHSDTIYVYFSKSDTLCINPHCDYKSLRIELKDN